MASWTEDTLTPRLRRFPSDFDRAVGFVMLKNAPLAENYMKTNAPWTDRTTNARNGLAARYAGKDKGEHSFVLFHQVPYGIYLETMQDGRFAIIIPTMLEFGNKVFDDLDGLLDRLGRGT